MMLKSTANAEFARGLKELRLKFNLLQKEISEIAGITQSVYSSYESGRTHMGLNDADNLSRMVWGVGYDEFVDFSKAEIILDELPKETQVLISESMKVTLKEQKGLLAKELDRLIEEGHLNSPITSKQLLAKMHPDLQGRKSTEITNLLIKAPRNSSVVIIPSDSKESLFQLKEFASREPI
ncbi:MAG: XRE family transcriptional regulator [Pedobacter sp.]|nr:MAG: XRE family transcriptional regulator [Pedobacter sp.]